MTDYYAKKLAGERLRHCYDIAPPLIKRYLQAEIDFVRSHLSAGDRVLELGCGYGRVMVSLADQVEVVIGVDSAIDSLRLGRTMTAARSDCYLAGMDALHLGFADDLFDVSVCIQNGICAFNVDQRALIEEALRVTRPCGKILFSTYTDEIWPERLRWFEAQASAGLLGPIDHDASRDGTIVCTDGFRSGRLTAATFDQLCEDLQVSHNLRRVADSALFCLITKRA